VKAKKLYPHELQAVCDRVAYALKCLEADMLARKVELLQSGAGAEALSALEVELAQRRTMLLAALATFQQSNEPTVLAEGDFTRIAEIAQLRVHDGDRTFGLLSEVELLALQTPRGSLAPADLDPYLAQLFREAKIYDLGVGG